MLLASHSMSHPSWPCDISRHLISALSSLWMRWALPLVPFVAIGAAYLVDRVVIRLQGRWREPPHQSTAWQRPDLGVKSRLPIVTGCP